MDPTQPPTSAPPAVQPAAPPDFRQTSTIEPQSHHANYTGWKIFVLLAFLLVVLGVLIYVFYGAKYFK